MFALFCYVNEEWCVSVGWLVMLERSMPVSCCSLLMLMLLVVFSFFRSDFNIHPQPGRILRVNLFFLYLNEYMLDALSPAIVPTGWLLRGGDVAELAHSFLFCSCDYFCLYGPFNCISFHKFSRRLSAFSLCSSDLISAVLVLSTLYLFIEVPFSPDVILRGWLGLKHQLTN